MIVALIDNGSLEAAAHRNLRALAAALSAETGTEVHAVSWKHSDRIAPAALGGEGAWTLASFVHARHALGEREFVFVPFFISAQGAIGSALRSDLETLRASVGEFQFTFAAGLGRAAIAAMVVDRIRATIRSRELVDPPVIVVDHGGPSPASAELRDQITADVRHALGHDVPLVAAASMEGAAQAHNHPLLVDALAIAPFNRGDVVIAPLFLAPGRHAGPGGHLAQFARAAEDRINASGRYHFTDLVGTHPRVVSVLAESLRATLATQPATTLT